MSNNIHSHQPARCHSTGVFNNALLTSLSASTRYYYVVGDPTYGVSAEYSFVTAPPVGTNETVKIFAIADLGYCESDGSLEWESDCALPFRCFQMVPCTTLRCY